MRIVLVAACAAIGISCSSPPAAKPTVVVDKLALAPGQVRVFRPVDNKATKAAKATKIAPARTVSLSGLSIKMSAASAPTDSGANTVRATSLSKAEALKVLARVPALVAQPADAKAVALRAGPKAPSRGTLTTSTALMLSAGGALPTVTSLRTLRVLRRAPTGKVNRTGGISVTFSHAMKSLSAHTKLTAADVPVKITPPIKGTWRWIDTRTLILEPAAKLPRATRFTVKIPASTQSVDNARLAKAVQWTFETPPPKVTHRWPRYQPLSRTPMFMIGFDQAVDPAKVLATMQLRNNATTHALRLVSAAELAATPKLVPRNQYRYLKKGHWFAYRTASPLPVDTKFKLIVGPKTPSLVGPLTTYKAQSFDHRTYGPFVLKRFACSGRCGKDATFQLVFTNPVDKKSAQQMIRVTPRPKKLTVVADGNWVYVRGKKRVGQTFSVTVRSQLRDIYGQRLAKTRRHRYTIKRERWWGSTLKGDNFVVLDPAGQPRYEFLSINHKAVRVKVYAVKPEHHRSFASYVRMFKRSHRGGGSNHHYYGYGNDSKRTTPPGRLVLTKIVRPRPYDQLTVQSVDLRAAFTKGLGHAIVVIEPVVPLRKGNSKAGITAWVQSTNLGVTALSDPGGVVILTTTLRDGKPVAGVRVGMGTNPSSTAKASNRQGVLELFARKKVASPLLFATKGADTAIVPWTGHGRWRFGPASRRLLWHVFDDRRLYRPGETVRVKGWVRSLKQIKGGDVEFSGMKGTPLRYKVRGPQGVELAKGTVKLNGLDGFYLSFRLPSDVNLGRASLQLEFPAQKRLSNRTYSHGFKVEEFRRPEFEVTTTGDAGPHLVGGHTNVRVRAAYYTGGALAASDLTWRVRATPGSYTPPNQQRFFFGLQQPWWHHYRRHHRHNRWGRPSYPVESYKAKTDSDGRHALRLDFTKVGQPRTMVVYAEASVSDINRQAWTDGTSFVVHPSSLYVGIRPASRFLDPGTLAVDSIVSNIAGKAVAGRSVTITTAPYSGSGAPQTCTVTSGAAAKRCVLKVVLPGLHRLSATVRDDQKRRHTAALYVWVSGGRLPGESNLSAEKLALTPDKKVYKPGDTAKVIVRSPFAPAEGILTVDRNGILSKRRFSMKTSTTTLDVAISDAHVPAAFVHVAIVGKAPRRDSKGKPTIKGAPRPAHASGMLRLAITPVSRILSVKVQPHAATLEPGAKTAVSVVVRDANGKPVAGAEVALIAVDESVLALGGYKIPDPITQTFYNKGLYYQSVGRDDLRRWVRLQKLQGKKKSMSAESRAMGGRRKPASKSAKVVSPVTAGPGGAKQMAVRKNFSALAVFTPAARTGADGRVKVAFKLPDNLTRYRVTAVVAAGKNHFGRGESSITARRLLMVRPSPPRFLSYGDRVEIPVVVQNLSKKDLTVRLAARTSNLRLTDTWGWQFQVPAGKRAEVRFAAATRTAGTARLQLVGVATGTELADAAQVSFPVWTPATSEAFAVYGHLDKGGIAQPITAPTTAIASVGGLDVTTSSTALTTLHDAVKYLIEYPFNGSEQAASRVLAMAALRDLTAAFSSKDAPTPKQIAARVQRDIKLLVARQRYDGSVRMWSGLSYDFPYVSVHVAHAFYRAKAKGYRVPKRALQRSRRYLRAIRRKLPKRYSAWSKHAIESYALFVRVFSGDKRAGRRVRAHAVRPGPAKVSMESNAWLLNAMATDKSAMAERTKIRTHLANRVTETASAAHFTTNYDSAAHQVMHSARRTDALVLDALIADRPKADLIGKVVKGLLAKRVKGRWLNTQENAFVLIALERYFRTYESVTPDLVASVWLGGKFAGDKNYRGRTVAQHRIHVPMRVLAKTKGAQSLIVHKRGKGRLYYRLGLAYAPQNLKLDAASHGFIVGRKYEGVDDKADVTRDKDGTWRIRAGARVRVSVSMVALAQRYHMVLVDKLPAGLEAVNPALATSSRLTSNTSASIKFGWRWYHYWFDHQNLRDERVEAFSKDLRAGSYVYSYVARATTPGTFIAAPAKAEEMYSPETFGRSASAQVIIE